MQFLLVPQPYIENPTSTSRTCIATLTDGSGEIVRKFTIAFGIEQSIKLPDEDDSEAYLLAICMDAMKLGADITVRGKVSRKLLSNLTEFIGAWNTCLPETYKLIRIAADQVVDRGVTGDGAVCAFTGGLDSTFSFYRHVSKNAGLRTQNVKLACLVHGFDVPLSAEAENDSRQNTVRRTIDPFGVLTTHVKFNFREFSQVEWEHSHAIALVAALINFNQLVDTCIIGSGRDYAHLHAVWGSSPITDHLLSSDRFQVIHDGATHTRTEKLAGILDWEDGLANLKVCWEGPEKDKNCGRCEKCLRTQASFLALGVDIPSSFPETTFSSALLKISDANILQWQLILDYAERRTSLSPWMKHVKLLILRMRVRAFVRLLKSKVRKVAKHFLDKLRSR